MHKKKIEQQLLRAVGTYVQQHLPPEGLLLVNVTSVSVTPNLGIAKIHLAILGKERKEQEAWLEAFLADHYYPIKRHIAAVLRHTFRKVPSELRFHLDDGHEKVARIVQLLETAQRPIAGEGKAYSGEPNLSVNPAGEKLMGTYMKEYP